MGDEIDIYVLKASTTVVNFFYLFTIRYYFSLYGVFFILVVATLLEKQKRDTSPDCITIIF